MLREKENKKLYNILQEIQKKKVMLQFLKYILNRLYAIHTIAKAL